MYNKALKKALSAEQKKVGFNLQLPIGLKKDFENLCKSNNVSVTSMIISLIEVTLEESALSLDPKIEKAISDLQNILKSENVFYPNPIELDNPMYKKKVSKDDFQLLLKIYKNLILAEYSFVHKYGPSDVVDYTKYQQIVVNKLESAKRYIQQIANNIGDTKSINNLYDEHLQEYLNISKEE